MEEDYWFLFDPPKDSDVFTRTLYYPRSPGTPQRTDSADRTRPESAQSALDEKEHAETLSKYAAGVFSSSFAYQETIAPFLNEHIPDQVHIPDRRVKVDNKSKVYCYRHQPDRRCQRRAPQEATVHEIQKVWFLLRTFLL
jgi:hypothetical protein